MCKVWNSKKSFGRDLQRLEVGELTSSKNCKKKGPSEGGTLLLYSFLWNTWLYHRILLIASHRRSYERRKSNFCVSCSKYSKCNFLVILWQRVGAALLRYFWYVFSRLLFIMFWLSHCMFILSIPSGFWCCAGGRTIGLLPGLWAVSMS